MFMRSMSLAFAPVLSTFIAGCGSGGSHGGGSEEIAVVHSATPEETAEIKSTAAITGDRATLYVNGLGCPLCASGVDKQLERLDGVKTVKVDLSTGTVILGFEPGAKHPSPDRIAEAVEDAGFTLVKIKPN